MLKLTPQYKIEVGYDGKGRQKMAHMLGENREINRLVVPVWLKNDHGRKSTAGKAGRKEDYCQIKEYLNCCSQFVHC